MNIQGFSYYRQPRHILVNGQMLPSPGIPGHLNHNNHQHHHHHPPSPPSPPLPPPPPPPPLLDSSMPRNFLRPIPVKREDKLFSSQEPSTPAKRCGNQFLTNINESPSSPPSAQVRRSLSMAKQQESSLDMENVKTKEVIPIKRIRDNMVNSLPKVNGQLVLRKPGNLFLSQLYFLFHLSLVICVLRANGKLDTFFFRILKAVTQMQRGKYQDRDSMNLFNTFSVISWGHQSSSSVPFVVAKMTLD